MSPRLGMLNYQVEEGYIKPFSDKTNKLIDEEVRRIINECYDRCKEILTDKKDLISKMGEALLTKETLTLPEIVDLLGPRPYPLKESLVEYLQELRERKVEEQ